jgi:hypothetical protein
MLTIFKSVNLVIKGLPLKSSLYFSNWAGGGNPKLVRRFVYDQEIITDTASNKSFSKLVESITG